MDRAVSPSLADELAAAQEWWREAGVDCVFADEPVRWLKETADEVELPQPAVAVRAEPQPEAPSPPSIGGNEADWPTDPEAFAQWWLTEPSLDAGGANPRVPPRGAAGAGLMVLVPQPEAEDRDRLLSGPQGRLLASFLDAAGIAEENTYVASALPRHTPHPDWSGLTRAGLGGIALHHAAIARPERVLLFGNDVLTLIGNNPAQNPAFLLNLNHQGRSVPALAARSLEHMLNIPSARSRFSARLAGLDGRLTLTMRMISRFACAVAAGTMALALASPAAADSAEYFRTRSIKNDVPTLLPREDREYYTDLFGAIHRADWKKVQGLLAQRKDGPLHSVALAEYYLAPTSPRVEALAIEAWLLGGINLPQAERLATMGRKRGLAVAPSLPYQQDFYRQPSVSKRVRPNSIEDGTMPAGVRDGILDRIKNDDPDGARQLLDGVDAGLSTGARAEWRQRVAWSYYIENRDPEALALATTAAEGSGPWVAEGEWVKGLAAWRLGDCVTALSGFEQSAARSTNIELTTAALYWANRAAVRCRMPEKADAYLRQAAGFDETLYGMLAAEQLGTGMPDRFTSPDFSNSDWEQLRDEENVRIAIELAEIGEDELASEVLLYQAKIGDPGDYDSLSRLARDLGFASTQLYMAYNAPRGGSSDPASRYPAPRWMPANGWRIDPALAFAHTLQESNFRTAVVSPAAAKGLMQITPITVREHAPRLSMSASQVDLTDPRVNLAFGQENLEMLRDAPATEGKLFKIMAAYNAGLAPITRWNGEVHDQGDPLLYMESIPYWETRSYVAIVLRNYWMYERQAGNDSPSRRALAAGKWPRFPGEGSSADGRVYLKSASAQ